MDLITIGLLAGAGLLAVKSGALSKTLSGPGTSGPVGPNGQVIQWPPNPGQPGYVTVGGSPAPVGYYAGDAATAQKIAGLGGTGAGVAGSIGGMVGGAGFAGSTAALALTGVGAVLAVGGIIAGIISKHHQEAVRREAAGLNEAVPTILQRLVLIIQAGVRGEIQSQDQGNALVKQAIDDYYSMVNSIKSGRWDVPGWPSIKAGDPANAKAPNPCNGPCVVGHWMEIYGLSTMYTIRDILAGKHGVRVFSYTGSPNDVAQKAHAGFSGMPAVSVVY